MILAAMLLPRFGRLGRQAAEITLGQLDQLLLTFAYRDSAGTQQVALWREAGSPFVSIVVMDEEAAVGEERAAWRPDLLIPPVRLPNQCELVEVLVDGEPVSPDEFLIATAPGGHRPSVDFVVLYEGIETVLSLPQNALKPRRISETRSSVIAETRAPIDLDAEGRDQEEW